VRDALETLGSLDALQTSPGVGAALSGARPTRREQAVYRCTTTPRGRLGAFPEIVAQHLAETTHEPMTRTLATFPSRLRERWRLDNTWEVPAAAGRRAFALLARRRTWTER
jgi:hypothetical protein